MGKDGKALKNSPPAVGVCVVTYKRPAQLAKLLQRLKVATVYPRYRVYVIIDYEEDRRTLKSLQENKLFGRTPLEKVEMFPSSAECVKATNRSYSIGDEPFFAWMSDDMEPEQGWLQEAMKCMATFPDGEGLVVFQDGIQNGRNACAGLISRNFIDTKLEGIFQSEAYVHFCADRELFTRSKRLERVKYCPTSMVWHNHPSSKGEHKSEDDSVYATSLPLWPTDKRMFQKRALRGFK